MKKRITFCDKVVETAEGKTADELLLAENELITFHNMKFHSLDSFDHTPVCKPKVEIVN